MKLLLIFVLLLSATCATIAQTSGEPGITNPNKIIRICAPSKGQLLHQPMIIIYSRDKVLYQSDTLPHKTFQPLSFLNPQSIKKISILKDTAQTKKYGGMAKNGVIEVYLDDKKYPKARKILLDSIKAMKKRKIN
jgi:hypothetical protein